MSRRLEKLLSPGERVIQRPTLSAALDLKITLAYFLFLPLAAYGIGWTAASLQVSDLPLPIMFAGMAGGIVLLTTVASLARARSIAVLTDRRLLLLATPIARQPTEVALSDVIQVHGLAKGNLLPVQVEAREGRIVSFYDEPWERNLGSAIAEAAGLSSADRRITRAKRVAGLLYRADRFGMLAGVALFTIGAMHLMNAVKFALDPIPLVFAFWIIPLLIMLVSFAGYQAGRIMSPILAVLLLRRSVPAEEMRDAFRLLRHRELLPRAKDDSRYLQPIIWRVAGLIYGQRFDPTLPQGPGSVS